MRIHDEHARDKADKFRFEPVITSLATYYTVMLARLLVRSHVMG